jgi:UDP-glucose 4-epimerase
VSGTEISPGKFVNATGPLQGKRILVTGGTGSLGKVLVRRILTGEWGKPTYLRILSRDEGKQHRMRVMLGNLSDEETGLAYRAIAGADQLVQYVIGDVRDQATLKRAVSGTDFVFNAAALKQVPSCEYFPWEAVRTNVGGAQNLVEAILDLPRGDRPSRVVGISTDKACKPVNVMGMSKAVQERVFQEANLRDVHTDYVCVRYGNVLASRGSVIPLFHHQIRTGGPVTVTHKGMTRFFLTLDQAVDTVMFALEKACPGDTVIPRVPSAKILDLAKQMVSALDREVEVRLTEIRPGEKLHEELVSAEEASRTVVDHSYYAIRSVLPEVRAMSDSSPGQPRRAFEGESYSSKDDLMNSNQVRELLAKHRLLEPQTMGEEVLR